MQQRLCPLCGTHDLPPVQMREARQYVWIVWQMELALAGHPPPAGDPALPDIPLPVDWEPGMPLAGVQVKLAEDAHFLRRLCGSIWALLRRVPELRRHHRGAVVRVDIVNGG